MKPFTFSGLGLCACILGSSPSVIAQGKGESITSASTKHKHLSLAWGMSPKQVADVYAEILTEEYRAKYRSVSPGIQMKNLDAQLAEENAAFQRSRIDFGRVPTALDSGPLKSEYTYMNQESMMSIERPDFTRYLFFIQDKLWKLVDEYSVGQNPIHSREATLKFAADLGTSGRPSPIQPDKTKYIAELAWSWRSNAHQRTLEMGAGRLGVVHENAATLAKLSSLRTHKASASKDDLDPAVQAVMMGASRSAPPKKK